MIQRLEVTDVSFNVPMEHVVRKATPLEDAPFALKFLVAMLVSSPCLTDSFR